MRKTYAVIGGDMRQQYLAGLLEAEGHTVYTWGFDKVTPHQTPLAQAAAVDVVILPLPVSQDGAGLNLPLSEEKLSLEELWSLLQGGGQLICGGQVKAAVAAGAAARGIQLQDYYDREEVQVANAVPTAEGAIFEAMRATDRTLHGAKALVIGFGRIGKLLARRLEALGVHVAVSARKYSDLAWIEAAGYQALRTGGLSGHLAALDLIFNTVPTPVLHRGLLEELPPACVIIDLASPPGGVDFDAAEELGRRVIWARGLPGKVAPATAAAAVRDAIHHILEERGEPI